MHICFKSTQFQVINLTSQSSYCVIQIAKVNAYQMYYAMVGGKQLDQSVDSFLYSCKGYSSLSPPTLQAKVIQICETKTAKSIKSQNLSLSETESESWMFFQTDWCSLVET